MIRARDSEGRDVLGLTRREIQGLLEGRLCCFREGKPEADSRHICIVFAETDADLVARLRAAYRDDEATRAAFDKVVDCRTKPARGDN